MAKRTGYYKNRKTQILALTNEAKKSPRKTLLEAGWIGAIAERDHVLGLIKSLVPDAQARVLVDRICATSIKSVLEREER